MFSATQATHTAPTVIAVCLAISLPLAMNPAVAPDNGGKRGFRVGR